MPLAELVKAPLRPARRKIYWIVAIRLLRHHFAPERLPGERLMHILRVGWGNTNYSASAEFLRAVAEEARRASGPILECGSGLSTILLAFYAARRDVPVFVLEHDNQWVTTVAHSLRRTRADEPNAKRMMICHCTLRDQGDHDWYAVPADLPKEISLVICDGPPGTTRGGRYGLLPAVWERLSRDCTILFDDAQRSDEQRVLRDWRERFGTSEVVVPVTGTRSFARVQCAPPGGGTNSSPGIHDLV